MEKSLIFNRGDPGRPMLVTPGTPAERVKIFREAYAKALKDPELLLETERPRSMSMRRWGRVGRPAQNVIDQRKEVVDE